MQPQSETRMSSFVYMKVLESSPWRYDRGIRWLSGGHVEELWRRLAERVSGPGRRVLDIGCGTGGASLACAALGGAVVGIDVDAEMLAVARSKAVPGDAAGRVEWLQLGAAEIEDRFAEATFDGVVASLALSEMSPEEQRYTLRIARSRLKPGGRLAVADEVRPRGAIPRLGYRIRRAPLAALTWLATQTSTQAITDLSALVRDAGFVAVRETRPWSSDLAIVEGVKPVEGSA
jgi:ubiquinone/menaquinone biosynthesis C-methylase UbiE